MADTLKASKAGLQIVSSAIRQKGWTKTQTALWWTDAQTSQATLRRFWRRIPINRQTFQSICQVAGVDWEKVAEIEDLPNKDNPHNPQSSLMKLSLMDCLLILLLLKT